MKPRLISVGWGFPFYSNYVTIFNMNAHENKLMGSQFEKILEKQAQMQGIGIRFPAQGGEFRPGGMFIPVYSELDCQLVHDRITLPIDAKTIQGTRILHSFLKPRQIKTAVWFNDQGINSGFIYWFREPNVVAFFTGHRLSELTKGESIHWSDGEYLGTYENFCLGNLFL